MFLISELTGENVLAADVKGRRMCTRVLGRCNGMLLLANDDGLVQFRRIQNETCR